MVRNTQPQVQSFRTFYEDEFAAIAFVAGTTAGDRSSGEDIAQEAFTRAHDDWDRVGGLDKPGAWVRRVAINLALSRRRRLQRETRALGRLGVPPQTTEVRRGDPEVWEAVNKLPPKQRASIVLRYHEGQPVAAIAEMLGCSTSAATSNLHKARTRLAQLLGENR